jgi:hypothetical protein
MALLPRASITSVFIALPSLALLSGCAGTAGSDCEEWGTRVESVKVCNSKGLNCSIEQQSVEYCARRSGQRAALADAPGAKAPGAAGPQPKEAQVTQAPEKTVKPGPAVAAQERAAPAPKKIGAANPAQALDKSGMPNLTRFWQSLFSASRYPGLRYGKVKKVTMSPATTPASSTQVEAALRTHVRSVVSMQVASDRKTTPMDHRLAAVVYRAHSREAASALYTAMMRDEWRDRKPRAQPGVTFVVVNLGDKNKPEASGQRIYLQRGPYVIDVEEWKSIYRDAAGKPVKGRQFPHSPPISPDVAAKAVISTFPAE